jgi:hypothetical protein
MALNPHLDDAGANAAADAVSALCNSGFIDIMSGTQPAVNGAATTVLASPTCAATAMTGSPAGGVATFAAIGSVAAGASGTATWFRAYKSDHTTALFDGSVGTATSNIVLNSVAIAIGATVSVTALTFTITE